MTENTTPTISKNAQPKKKARAMRALNSTVQSKSRSGSLAVDLGEVVLSGLRAVENYVS